MDALQVTFSNTLLGRLYVLLLYAMAAFAVVSQLENTVIVLLFLLLLLILFYREWQRLFSASFRSKDFHITGLRYQTQSSQQQWSLLVGSDWQPVSGLKMYYRVPWLIALRAVDYPSHQPFTVIIWRDSVTAQDWRLLRIYLSL